MNDTCGIDRRDIAHQGVAQQGVAHQGVALRYLDAGALPLQSPNGAPHASPGQRPGYARRPLNLGLKARPNGRTVRPGLQPSISFQSEAQGVALGYLKTGALPLKMERKLL